MVRAVWERLPCPSGLPATLMRMPAATIALLFRFFNACATRAQPEQLKKGWRSCRCRKNALRVWRACDDFFWQIQLPADNSNLFYHSCFAYDGIWGSLVEEATAFPFDVTCRLWMVAEPSPNKSAAPPFVLIWKKKRSIIFHDSQIYSSLPSLVRKGFGIILHSMWLAKPNIC